MLDEKTAATIGGLCADRLDHAIIGDGGGTVTIFADGSQYHTVYGLAGGDPVRETIRSRNPARLGAACPVICTAGIHDGMVETDVRYMPPLVDDDAYEYIAGLELDRRLIHDEIPEGSWPHDAVEAWRRFREGVEDAEPGARGVFDIEARTLELAFALSELTATHYRLTIR